MLIKLSHVLDNATPSYGNRDTFRSESVSSINNGCSANSQKWILSTNHIGTHIDVPRHFDNNGKSLTDFDDSYWLFSTVELVDIPLKSGRLISRDDFKEEISFNSELLLIRTGYEKFRGDEKYWKDNPGISRDCAAWLRSTFPNLRVIGFDFLSLTSWNYRMEGRESHFALLGNETIKSRPVCIIEDMALNEINSSISRAYVAPMFVEGADGAPVTVFAELR